MPTLSSLIRTRSIASGVAALAVATLVSACGTSADTAATSVEASADGTFPTTIDHAFGRTTIDTRPERIVTMGWNAQDILHALGMTPVGQPKYTYGANADGVMPWAEDYFDSSTTTLIEGSGAAGQPSAESLAVLRPDLILAPYEGFEKPFYDSLAGVSKTVAYPGKAWQTTWQDQTTIIGQAVGKPTEARALIDGLDRQLATTATDHPEFAGKTLSVVNLDTATGNANVYLPSDPRVELLNSLGFRNSAGVQELAAANDVGTFFKDISLENIADIDADVVVAFVNAGTDSIAIPSLATLPAFNEGRLISMSDEQVVSGLSNVNVVSTPWVLDKILPDLTAAADKSPV